ncbi:hypothetical protein MKZ38_006804 [Zalerion maritima]|uniref:Tetraspanin Tsp3 n=1 Tax=Zalerion maritima TaxID=339359 RepID=A0AAD5RWZ4_9PEZI|nr:hypothetical protein MKZ38_006804 [Zalerion maritima]
MTEALFANKNQSPISKPQYQAKSQLIRNDGDDPAYYRNCELPHHLRQAVALLTSTAIASVVNLSDLHLPVPLAVQVLMVFLPPLAGLATIWRPNNSNFIHTLMFGSIQAVPAILTVVLATLFGQLLPNGDFQSCLLSTQWQNFWESKDAGKIRDIQDALGCCGLNSVRDRPWPFPQGQNPDLLACAHQFHRTISCASAWKTKMRTWAGVAFAIVLVVGVLQCLYLIFGQNENVQWPWWSDDPSHRTSNGQRRRIGGINRRLLTGGDDEETQVEPYRDEEPGTQDRDQNSDRRQQDGPRVEPGGLVSHESNEWRDV